MNTMAKQLNIVQAEKLIHQLKVMYGDELEVRVIVALPSEKKLGDIIPDLKLKGYAAHPESSSYAEREVVVTSKVRDENL